MMARGGTTLELPSCIKRKRGKEEFSHLWERDKTHWCADMRDKRSESL
jgi:hypothetical protein